MTPDANGWLPIETAPKDRSVIMVWATKFGGEISGVRHGAHAEFASFSDGGSDYAGNDWWDCQGGDAYSTWCVPTHWQPLPLPPIIGSNK